MDAIAIVGIAARLPQEAVSSEQFWELIRNGRRTTTEIPNDRINIDAFYHPDNARSDTTNVRSGNFLRGDMGAFDAPFFAIQPAEAESMDPQQRLLLETSYHALEDAGMPMEQVAGSRTGVFFAASTRDYEVLLYRDAEQAPKYMGTGIGSALLANRVSWFLDLSGPSITIDTACSGSLTAIHLACQNLRSGECDMALAGGGSLVLAPEVAMSQLSTLGFLSPDGRSYSFDSRANGYAKGEGLGMVVLKRVDDAIRDGDTIRAVLRATAINQDGRTPGITQPSRKAQTENILSAYQTAGLELDETVYFEAHGTGTAVGDPIEAGGLHDAFRRPRDNPLYMGALKANIGHLEAGAGIAATIKAVLMLEHGIIPPIAGLEQPNPNIPIDEWNLKFLDKAIPFPNGKPRRISINSFGYGGTNAHAILDDARSFLAHLGRDGKHATAETTSPPSSSTLTSTDGDDIDGYMLVDSAKFDPELHENGHGLNENGHTFLEPQLPRVMLLSAADEAGVKRLAESYEQHLQRVSRMDPIAESRYLDNLTYTLSSRRSNLPWKGFAIARTIDELRTRWASVLSKPVRSGGPPAISFVFTGQGAQWHAMTKGLDAYAVFTESLSRSQKCLERCGCSWDLLDELSKNIQTSRVDEPEFAQPLCTVLQIGLVDLLASWNLHPAAVVGHSSGEIAAAYCVGAISHEVAIQVAYHRGRAASRIVASRPGQGGMLAVALSVEDVTPYLTSAMSRTGGLISVGCINAPHNLTITGDAVTLNVLQEDLDGKGIFARQLQVGAAYHSHHMQELADDYLQSLQSMPQTVESPRESHSVMFSSVTGERVGSKELARPSYWVQNLLSKVEFAKSLTHMVKNLLQCRDVSGRANHDILVEIGPHSALQRPIRDTIRDISEAKNFDYNPVLVRDTDPTLSVANLTGRLRCWGVTLDLAKVGSPQTPTGDLQVLSGLPAYEFNHSRSYWTESRVSKGFRFRAYGRHELLGVQESDWNPLQPKWRNVIRLSEHKWISDHRFGEQQLYPAAGMIVMAIEACRQLVGPDSRPTGYQFHDLAFPAGFSVPIDADTVEAQIHLIPHNSTTQGAQTTGWNFQIFAWVNGAWSLICRGEVAPDWAPKRSHSLDEARLRSLGLGEPLYNPKSQHWVGVSSKQFYETLAACGENFGPTFQTLQDIRTGGDEEATARIVLDSWMDKVEGQIHAAPHVIHPTDLDAMLQTGVAAYCHGGHRSIPVLLPTRLESLWISHDLIDRKPLQTIRLHGRTTFQGYREADFAIGAIDDEDSIQLLVSGFRQTALNGSDSDADQSLIRSCFTIDWRPDVDLLSSDEIEDLCYKAVDPRTLVLREEVDRQELVSLFYLKRALDTVSSQQIEGLPSHLKKYMSWADHAFDKEQYEHLLQSYAMLVSDEVSQNEFLSEVAEQSVASKIIVTTGRNFDAIIQGDVDPLELFMGGENILEEFYTGATFETCFKQITTYIDLMAHKNPAMKILEVGAGTGATTRRVLSSLTRYTDRTDGQADIPRFQSYTFTDISPGFFEEAKQRLAHFPDRVEYAVFNLEKSAQEQGFESEKYDLIVASLVLHATTNIAQTLQRIRSVLKPHGKLIVLEATAPSKARMSFFFGLLPGWWLSEEEEREWCPLLDEAGWHRTLQANGFSGMDVRFPDHIDPSLRSFNGFVSTALETPLEPVDDLSKIIVIASEESETQMHLAQGVRESLANTGQNVSILAPKDTTLMDLNDRQCISLLEIDQSFFENIGDDDWTWFKNILNSTLGVLWVTYGGTLSNSIPSRALVKGLGRAIRSENVNAHFVELALQLDSTEKRAVDHIVQVYQQSLRPCEGQREAEFVEEGGNLRIGRVNEAMAVNWQLHQATGHRDPKVQEYRLREGRVLKLNIGTPGLLQTLCFDDDEQFHETPLGPEDVEIEVFAVGGSLVDAQVATGELSSNFLGHECSGIVTRAGSHSGYQAGDLVAASTTSGAYKSLVRSDASAVMKVPEGMSLTTAATIPTAFATAYYSLVLLSNIQETDTVLVDFGESDVGQAAIQIAQRRGARILTTVGGTSGRTLLQDTYHVPDELILSSEDPDLAIKISVMAKTGVDVVLSSIGSETREALWACIAPLGKFVELASSKSNLTANRPPTHALIKGVSHHSVCLDVVLANSKTLTRKIMHGVAQLFTGTDATHAPQPQYRYSLAQIEKAFRFMLDKTTNGKVVVELRPEDEIQVLPSSLPTYYFDSKATYVIVGGLGGLGQEMVRWMVKRKARYFLLLSRSGPEGSETARDLLEEMTAKGVVIVAPRCDVTNEASVAAAFDECARGMPPIKGCIQGAMVLRDALLESTAASDIHAVLRPKTVGTLNLAKHLPHDLDFFVLLSSISGITGSRGQANYAMANTFQDAIARQLAAEGRACLSLNLGSILSVGYAAENDLTTLLRRDGFIGLPVSAFLGLLDWACHPANRTARDSMTAQLVSGLAGAQSLDADHFRNVYWASKPVFKPLLQLSTTKDRPANAEVEPKKDFAANLEKAEDAAGLLEVALAALTDRLARLLAVPIEDIDSQRPITAYGIDSLIALELRQWLKTELKADVTVLDVMQTESVEALAKIVAGRSKLSKLNSEA